MTSYAKALIETLSGLILTAVFLVVLSDLLFTAIRTDELQVNSALVGWGLPTGPKSGDEIATAIGRSLALLVVALLASLPLALLAALVYRRVTFGPLRSLIWTVGIAGSSLPAFFWAVLAQLAIMAYGEQTRIAILPTYGYGLDQHLILPALALAARPFSYAFRLSAVALEEVANAEHVRTARAKGLGESVVLGRHIFPNAAPAILAGMVIASRSAVSSLAIIEIFFGWGGAGVGFVKAIVDHDAVAASLFLGAFTVLSAMLVLASGVAAVAVTKQHAT